jgi:hypothetical protein
MQTRNVLESKVMKQERKMLARDALIKRNARVENLKIP